MKITSKHLESARDLLQTASAKKSQASAAVEAAKTDLDKASLEVHGFQVAFDNLAASFASGAEFVESAASALPKVVQDAIGFVKEEVAG